MSKKVAIPPGSLVEAYLPADHADAFAVTGNLPAHTSPDDILVGFWVNMPRWVSALLRLRNFLVRFVGLKGAGGPDPATLEQSIRNGERCGIMSVLAKDPHETVCLLTDKHLDAYISVRITSPTEVVATTLVKYHNRLGRAYFFFIRPFHNIIVPHMVRKSI